MPLQAKLLTRYNPGVTVVVYFSAGAAMPRRRTTYDPPCHVDAQPVRQLSDRQLTSLLSGSALPGTTDGLPSAEHRGDLRPYQARGLYPNPGIYEAITRQDAIIDSGIERAELSMASYRYTVIEPADASDEELEQTAHARLCLDGVDGGIVGLVMRMMTQRQYGFSIQEQVWEVEEHSGLWRLEDCVWIPPWAIRAWVLDSSGVARGIITTDETGELKTIPMSKVLYSGRRTRSRQYEGVSVLRPLVDVAGAKQRALATNQVTRERSGEGTLLQRPPENESEGSAGWEYMRSMGDQWASGDTAVVQLLPGWDVEWDYGGSPQDITAFLQYLDHQSSTSCLNNLSELASSDQGSRALGETYAASSGKTLDGLGMILCHDVQTQVIHRIYDQNGWDPTRACRITMSGQADQENLRRIYEFATVTLPDGAPLLQLTDAHRRQIARMLHLE